MKSANANPATPTTKFTKLFKRLVNFLNLRKNMNKALLAQIWYSEGKLWRHCGSGESDGRRRFAQRPDASHRSFRLKSNALAWAREQELEADQGRPQVHKTLKGITVADIVIRYRRGSAAQARGRPRCPLCAPVLSPRSWRRTPTDYGCFNGFGASNFSPRAV